MNGDEPHPVADSHSNLSLLKNFIYDELKDCGWLIKFFSSTIDRLFISNLVASLMKHVDVFFFGRLEISLIHVNI